MGVTKFPHGVSSNNPNGINLDMPITEPSKMVVQFDDFTTFYPDLETAAGTGAARYGFDNGASGGIIQAAGDVVGGRAQFQSAASASSGAIMFSNNRSFEYQMNVPLWFECRLNIDDINCAWLVGTTDDETAPLAPTNGIYFTKASASADLSFVCIHQGSPAAIDESVGDIVVGEDVVLGFYWDGTEMHWGRDEQELGSATVDAADLPLDMVDLTAGYQTTDATVDNMFLDYFWAVTPQRTS